MAVPARLETVPGKLGVMAPEHVIDPGPEQAQGRCALGPCGQVWPPDGPLAPGLGRLPPGQLRCQRGAVIEAGSEFSNSLPLRVDVLAEGAQAPVQPLILVELLGRGVIEMVFQFSDSLPLSLDVLAEGVQAPVKPFVLVELAVLVLAEVSQEPGQLGCLPVEPFEAAGTAAEGFIDFGQPPGDPGDLLGQGRHLPAPGRSLCFAHGLVLTRRRCLRLRHGADPHLPAASCSLPVAPRRAGRDDDAAGLGRLPRPGGSWPRGGDEGALRLAAAAAGHARWPACGVPAARVPGGPPRAVGTAAAFVPPRPGPGPGRGGRRDRRRRFPVCHPRGCPEARFRIDMITERGWMRQGITPRLRLPRPAAPGWTWR